MINESFMLDKCKTDVDFAIEYIMFLQKENAELKERVKELEEKLNYAISYWEGVRDIIAKFNR